MTTNVLQLVVAMLLIVGSAAGAVVWALVRTLAAYRTHFDADHAAQCALALDKKATIDAMAAVLKRDLAPQETQLLAFAVSRVEYQAVLRQLAENTAAIQGLTAAHAPGR